MQFFEGDENFSWRVLGVESFVIMLSVLLGFTLNGWRTSQGEQETVEAALRSIAREMRFNKRQLEDKLPYYRAMAAAFDSLESTIDEELILTREVAFERIPGYTGLDVPILRTYRTALATGAFSKMDFELANSISTIYTVQNLYSNIIGKFITATLNDHIEKVGDHETMFGEFEQVGEDLNDAYAELLKALAEERGIAAAEVESTDSTRTEPRQAKGVSAR